MPVSEQLTRLVEVGVADLAGLSGKELLAHADGLPEVPDSVLAVHPSLVPASRLATVMRHEGKPGFVVHDMGDLEALERNHRFMTIASRKLKGKGLDARTPAIRISGGTGHDGVANRNAPKVGWCWAGNRHTWLGFASARHRSA
jgi:hypothetical protein